MGKQNEAGKETFEQIADNLQNLLLEVRKVHDFATSLMEKMSGWHPIETAPKGGAEILMRFVGRRPYVTGVKWHNGCFVQLSDYMPVENLTATHWMPIPVAPDAAMQAK